jgi:hypothetical protein
MDNILVDMVLVDVDDEYVEMVVVVVAVFSDVYVEALHIHQVHPHLSKSCQI